MAASNESSLLLLLLAVITLSVVVINILLLSMMVSMRRTMTKVESLLPGCRQAIEDAGELLDRTNRLSRGIETAAASAGAIMHGLITQVQGLKNHAESLLTGTAKNGAKPRGFRRRTGKQ